VVVGVEQLRLAPAIFRAANPPGPGDAKVTGAKESCPDASETAAWSEHNPAMPPGAMSSPEEADPESVLASMTARISITTTETSFIIRRLLMLTPALSAGLRRALRSQIMTEVRGARALVTGANGGLGRAIAIGLRAQGAELVVTGRRAGPVEAVAAEVGGRAIVADLADRSQLERILAEAGDLDILVANAALPASGDLGDWEQHQIDRVLEVNLANPIAMTRALLPRFRERGSGHFVYVSSLSGKVASKGASLYSATKFGLRGFAGGLRADVHGSGIGVSVIFPGFVRDAGMFADSGATLPRGVGTVSPEAVTKAVLKAIRADKAEVDVAPISLRAGALIGALAPGLSATVQARVGNGLSEQLIEAQRDKR
jgi:short-subunit dehydrogenase